MPLTRYIIITLLTLSSIPVFSQSYILDAAAEKRWHIKETLADKNTMPLAKDIYLNKTWTTNNENLETMLHILDSFPKMNNSVKGFYFTVIAISFDKADGAYSEGLGYAGKAYIDSDLAEFLNYFTGYGKLPDIYLQKWAGIASNEMELIKVNQDPKILTKLHKYYDALCKDCHGPQKTILKQYEDLIKTYVK